MPGATGATFGAVLIGGTAAVNGTMLMRGGELAVEADSRTAVLAAGRGVRTDAGALTRDGTLGAGDSGRRRKVCPTTIRSGLVI